MISNVRDWDFRENAECAAEMAKLIPLYDALKSEAEMNDWKAHMRFVSRTKSSDSDRNFREFKKKRAQWGREKEELREETEELRKENDKLKAKKMSVSGGGRSYEPPSSPHSAHSLVTRADESVHNEDNEEAHSFEISF